MKNLFTTAFFLLILNATFSQWTNTGAGNIYYNGGSVGIGVPPRAKLDVAYTTLNTLSSVFGRLSEGNSTGDGTYLGVRSLNTQPVSSISFSLEHKFNGQLNSAINFYRGPAYTGGFLTFATNNGSEKMRIDVNGNIGIGTTSPTQKLQVNGTTLSNVVWIGSGINSTNSSGYLLAVNGAAIFTKAVVKLQSNWPDYVFEKNYNLLSIDSLESYINQNKHLPEMPSAEEIKAKDGVDLQEINTKLLQKVEELTLYIIELKKDINKLKELSTKK